MVSSQREATSNDDDRALSIARPEERGEFLLPGRLVETVLVQHLQLDDQIAQDEIGTA